MGADPETNEPLQASGSYHSVEKQSIRTTNIRWLALILACSCNFGSYFCFDNPQSLQKSLKIWLGMDNKQYGMLYSVYSIPNIALPFFSGLIIDRIGVRITLMTFAGILVLGQLVVAFGVASQSYAIVLVGRVIFGLGGESLGVANSSVTAKWFMGKELAFAMGATLCVSRLGSSLNSTLSPRIKDWTGHIWAPFVFGAILCTLSWIGVIALSAIDKKADQQEGIAEKKEETEKFRLKDFKNFSLLFYLLLFNCFFIYGAFFGLNNNLSEIMQDRFGFSEASAGNYIPIVYLCSAIITPFFGLFTDKYGKRIVYMLIASAIFFADHLVIAFLPDGTIENPQYGMVAALLGVGLFYSTYAAVFWPCVPLVVPENIVGTAYGIITSLQNCMLAIIPILLGWIHDNTLGDGKGYFYTEIFLAVITAIGFIITTMIFIEDMRKDKRLHKASSKKTESVKRSGSGSFLK